MKKPLARSLSKTRSEHKPADRPAPAPTTPPTNGRRWLSIKEVSALIGVSVHHAYAMHRAGRLPSFRLEGVGVRVDRKALEAKIEHALAAQAKATGTNWPS